MISRLRKENNCNTHVAQYSRRKGNQTINFGQLTEYLHEKQFP